jgi:ABC-2 type transport system permease protein
VTSAFPYLLLPGLLSARNRVRRRQRGDGLRAGLFGGVGVGVFAALFGISFWLAWQLAGYQELGDYLVRLGLSWLFLTFLSFVAFSSVVAALNTFFLSEDLRLLLCAPVPPERFFYARYARTAGQSAWMVVVFVLPVLLGLGVARCAGPGFYLAALATVPPFVLIPVSLGSVVTLVLVNVFPARRARDVLMLMGLLFAVALVMLLRFVRPERLLNVESLPDVTAFFTALRSPVMPLLPSFWAGETLFAALQGGGDRLHLAALWTTALASMLLARAAFGRFYFSGWSKAQEGRKARFTRLRFLEPLARRLPLRPPARNLLLKDLRVFLRDTAQWSQLLLLLALASVYIYNFSVIDLQRVLWMGPMLKNVYAFVNLALASFVLSALAVRFVFPAVSIEGASFWIVRSAPVSLRSFLWSKFWTGAFPILALAEILTVAANEFLGVPPLLKIVCALAIVFMTFALVGLAAGMGAMHPRFDAENVTQAAGSYGGVAYMIFAVLYILVEIALVGWAASSWLWYEYQDFSVPAARQALIALALGLAAAISVATFWLPMQRGVLALEGLGE